MIRRDRYLGQILGLRNWPRHLPSAGDYGADQNRNTGSNYARQTGTIYLHVPFIVKSILWDVRTADDYICRFVTTLAGTTSEFDVNTSVSVGGTGEIEITPTNGDFILTPGAYYLQLATHDGATVGWSDYNAYQSLGTVVSLAGLYYTASDYYQYTIPVKLRGFPLLTSNFTKYARM